MPDEYLDMILAHGTQPTPDATLSVFPSVSSMEQPKMKVWEKETKPAPNTYRLKPLAWKHNPHKTNPLYDTWTADSILETFEVEYVDPEDGYSWSCGQFEWRREGAREFTTPEDAIAAANKWYIDYMTQALEQ